MTRSVSSIILVGTIVFAAFGCCRNARPSLTAAQAFGLDGKPGPTQADATPVSAPEPKVPIPPN